MTAEAAKSRDIGAVIAGIAEREREREEGYCGLAAHGLRLAGKWQTSGPRSATGRRTSVVLMRALVSGQSIDAPPPLRGLSPARPAGHSWLAMNVHQSRDCTFTRQQMRREIAETVARAFDNINTNATSLVPPTE